MYNIQIYFPQGIKPKYTDNGWTTVSSWETEELANKMLERKQKEFTHYEFRVVEHNDDPNQLDLLGNNV